ncbi:ParB N-terminal domain-containing protein [Micromonospora sp. NPDC049051]|uniref:ParB N-terminal domain-containing protein n=1 Tax=Micromonospora sp. NPDC049051 TaxID=3364264 RepID=UPI00371F7FD4
MTDVLEGGADDSDVVLVRIDSLLPAESPRLGGINDDHVRLLAQSEIPLPPILVQLRTMRVIDGMHRLKASQLNGAASIRARLLNDDDGSAYLRGVTTNIAHGLPLSLADRRAAASRLIKMYPHWSDRSLGRAAGLSGKTIGALRRDLGEATPGQRTGRDGRIRPVSNATSRKVVSELLTQRPTASLREIARTAGVSPNTVRSVRDKMEREGPADDDHSAGLRPHLEGPGVLLVRHLRTDTTLANLSRDPSLRYTEAGRALLRMLHHHSSAPIDGRLVAALPPHCLPVVAQVARNLAGQWEGLADLVERRARLEAV